MLLVALTSCGSDDGEETAEGFDAVSIDGEVGSAPEVDWKSRMDAGDPDTETLVEGDGTELADGDSVVVNYWLGNGYTQDVSLDTFGTDDAGTVVTVGEEPTPPQQAADVVNTLVAGEIEAGMTVGTRIAVTVGSAEAFGDSLPAMAEFDVGNEDALLLVIDLVDQPLEAPDGKAGPEKVWAPSIVEKGGLPSGLDFEGIPAPPDQLRIASLIEGTGDEVEDGDVLVANYLGQVYQAEAPFDESYSKGAPVPFPIGLGGVVKGWDEALVGVPVGSRVMLQIPPRLGYGEEGNPQAGIKGTDTLYFVIDILAAA